MDGPVQVGVSSCSHTKFWVVIGVLMVLWIVFFVASVSNSIWLNMVMTTPFASKEGDLVVVDSENQVRWKIQRVDT